MATYTQASRPLRFSTPLGPDRLLITAFEGAETISQLYRFSIELKGGIDEADFGFEKVLGQPAKIELETGTEKRYFHGILSRFSRGVRGPRVRFLPGRIGPLPAGSWKRKASTTSSSTRRRAPRSYSPTRRRGTRRSRPRPT